MFLICIIEHHLVIFNKKPGGIYEFFMNGGQARALPQSSDANDRHHIKTSEFTFSAGGRLVHNEAAAIVDRHVSVVADQVAGMDLRNVHGASPASHGQGVHPVRIGFLLAAVTEMRIDLGRKAGAVGALLKTGTAPDVRKPADKCGRVVSHLLARRKLLRTFFRLTLRDLFLDLLRELFRSRSGIVGQTLHQKIDGPNPRLRCRID